MNRIDGHILGATVREGVTELGLYTTRAKHCEVRFFSSSGVAQDTVPMQSDEQGYYSLSTRSAPPGTLYKFVLDGNEVPDPYARFAPGGVHAPAMVVESGYTWRNSAPPERPLSEHVIYELHIGTFTPEGTYAAARKHLAHIKELGATMIELMPLSSFPGKRGWGYDGVLHFAPYAPYGTPDELRHFVDEAHGLGLGVLLDVVYNHFGPDGNYLREYSLEYFRHDIVTRWGDAPDFSRDIMRRLVISNALYWLTEFRFDGLRLDATGAIVDDSDRHILADLASAVSEVLPKKLLIAEDESNDPALVTQQGMNAVWADDFHHQLHVTLTRERDGYYAAYVPGAADLARIIERGWLYEGEHYAPWGEGRGKPAGDLSGDSLVYSVQNHDQIGNRPLGNRLSTLISEEAYCAASLLLLFLPACPLLFMGQEWAASSPFQYFTDHEPELGAKVTIGRRDEFRAFTGFQDCADVPDPQAESTFTRSRLDWAEKNKGRHAHVLAFHKMALAFRREDPVMRSTSRKTLSARAIGDVLVVRRFTDKAERILVVSFGSAPVPLESLIGAAPATLVMSSGQEPVDSLAPMTAALFRRD